MFITFMSMTIITFPIIGIIVVVAAWLSSLRHERQKPAREKFIDESEYYEKERHWVDVNRSLTTELLRKIVMMSAFYFGLAVSSVTYTMLLNMLSDAAEQATENWHVPFLHYGSYGVAIAGVISTLIISLASMSIVGKQYKPRVGKY